MCSGPLWMHLDKAVMLLAGQGHYQLEAWRWDSRWRQKQLYHTVKLWQRQCCSSCLCCPRDSAPRCRPRLSTRSNTINETSWNVLKILPIYFKCTVIHCHDTNVTTTWMEWKMQNIKTAIYKQYQRMWNPSSLCCCTCGINKVCTIIQDIKPVI